MMESCLLLVVLFVASTPRTKDSQQLEKEPPGIRCPYCRWEVQSGSLWVCRHDGLGLETVGCGHSWPAFCTNGVCPKCSKHWVSVECPQCGNSSPFMAWYHDPNNI